MQQHNTPKRYAIHEACTILDIDRVTLSRWMKKEHIKAQRDPIDKRFKYLTREQLELLARAHGRTLQEEQHGSRLTGWQREMQVEVQQLKEEMRYLRARLGVAEDDDDRDTTARLRPGEWQTLDPIPQSWIAPDDLAEQLGVSLRTFKHALRPRYDGDPEQHGTIGWHPGKWRRPHPGNYATQALDPDQQLDAQRRFAQISH